MPVCFVPSAPIVRAIAFADRALSRTIDHSLFPKVSGSVVQVSPLIERIPWIHGYDRLVTIPDRLFAGFTEYHAPLYHYYFYLRDQQPLQLGASYRYFVAHFNDQREIQEIIPAGDVNLPLN